MLLLYPHSHLLRALYPLRGLSDIPFGVLGLVTMVNHCSRTHLVPALIDFSSPLVTGLPPSLPSNTGSDERVISLWAPDSGLALSPLGTGVPGMGTLGGAALWLNP